MPVFATGSHARKSARDKNQASSSSVGLYDSRRALGLRVRLGCVSGFAIFVLSGPTKSSREKDSHVRAPERAPHLPLRVCAVDARVYISHWTDLVVPVSECPLRVSRGCPMRPQRIALVLAATASLSSTAARGIEWWQNHIYPSGSIEACCTGYDESAISCPFRDPIHVDCLQWPGLIEMYVPCEGGTPGYWSTSWVGGLHCPQASCQSTDPTNCSSSCCPAVGVQCNAPSESGCSGPPGEGQLELCDGRDNNANGQIDETCECTVGATRSCAVGECTNGSQSCDIWGQWGACTGGQTSEICDGKDNDCNGQTDDSILCGKCGTQSTPDCGTCQRL